MPSSFLVVSSSFQSVSSPETSSRLTFHHLDADLSSDDNDNSSIGSASDDEDPVLDGQDDVQSKSTADGAGSNSSFDSLSSLEDSLPIKRGLSSHFMGKSRSFSNLAECANTDVGEIAKPENSFNRKRRIEIASIFSYKRRASYNSLVSTMMLPPLLSAEHALHEEDEENEEDEKKDDNENDVDDSRDDEHGGIGRNSKKYVKRRGIWSIEIA